MAASAGFEPAECQSQSLMPYRLAIPPLWKMDPILQTI